MNEHECRELCERMVEQFALPETATYKDACRRVGEVMSELLGATVELRFISMRGTRLSGATALRADGTYVVYCARSRSWYHRLGILLHELAHVLLGHRPVALAPAEPARHFAPHLPGKMARIIARRTAHGEGEERQAEEFADLLLERLTDRHRSRPFDSSGMSPSVARVAEGLSSRPRAKPGER